MRGCGAGRGLAALCEHLGRHFNGLGPALLFILTGIVGLCLVVGGVRFGEQSFGLHGVSASIRIEHEQTNKPRPRANLMSTKAAGFPADRSSRACCRSSSDLPLPGSPKITQLASWR